MQHLQIKDSECEQKIFVSFFEACDETCRSFPNDQSLKALASFLLQGFKTFELFISGNKVERETSHPHFFSRSPANENEILHCVISDCFKNAVSSLSAVSSACLACSTGLPQLTRSGTIFLNIVYKMSRVIVASDKNLLSYVLKNSRFDFE